MKYLRGGIVTSKTDGDRHHVSGYELIKLYGLEKGECFIIKNDQQESRVLREGHKILRPLYSGNYTQGEI